MDVDTGQFMAITEQVAALAAKVDWLERREHQRDAVAEIICGSGSMSPRPRPRHLRSVHSGQPGR